MRGYKVTDLDGCGWDGFKYEVGKTYENKKHPDICVTGYHFCKDLDKCYDYYPKDKSRTYEVEATGTIVEYQGIYCTDEITIIRELSPEEILYNLLMGAKHEEHYAEG